MSRGMDQLRSTAPVYVGIAYSIANWIGMKLKLNITGLSGFVPHADG